MMTRQEVFKVIDNERQYQDSLWPPHDGHKRSEHCLTSLQAYIRKSQDAWIAGDRKGVWQQIGKMAAIVTRALELQEQVNLLEVGLR